MANGGTCNVSSVSVADGLPIGILPTPVLTNAVFLGWFTSADGGSQMDEAMIVTQSTTLYAHWLPQTLDGQWMLMCRYGLQQARSIHGCRYSIQQRKWVIQRRGAGDWRQDEHLDHGHGFWGGYDVVLVKDLM